MKRKYDYKVANLLGALTWDILKYLFAFDEEEV